METVRRRQFITPEPIQTLKLVRELDAFPKIPESYKEKSVSGGGISIVTFILIAILIVSEVKYYTNTELKFDYKVDTDSEVKMRINIDMVIAMKCKSIGADILDMTNQDTHSFGQLNEEPAHFKLSPNQQRMFDTRRDINRYLRNEYHAIHDLLWVSGYKHFFQDLPPREDNPAHEPDACRLYGSLEINKVAGNFHITAGKSIPVIPRGHAHLSLMLDEKDYNFSHRINHFSFGEGVAGTVHPLDGEEFITINNYHIYQYFVQIVPTDVRTYASNVKTYQFAVTEKNRTIDHSRGSHGVPGIFFKYDISPLKIRVSEEHRPYSQFLVRLCGIVGGMFAVSGMINALVVFIVDTVCCRYRRSGSTRSRSSLLPDQAPLMTTPPAYNPFISSTQIPQQFSANIVTQPDTRNDDQTDIVNS